MHAGLRSALFGSALPLAGFELGMDFRAGWYRSGGVVTRDPAALPGYSFVRTGAKFEDVGGGLLPVAAGIPAIFPGVGYIARRSKANAVNNSNFAGAIAGNPGTPPTKTQIGTGTLSNGITRQIVATGTDPTTGIPYIDYRFFGTASATVPIYPMLSHSAATEAPSAVAGEIWTAELGFRILPGAVLGTTRIVLTLDSRNDEGNAIGVSFNVPLVDGGVIQANPPRVSRTTTALPSTNSARMWMFLSISLRQDETYDFTMRLSAPSLVRSPITGPYVATSNGPISSGNDDMRVTGPTPLDEDWVIIASAVARTSATLEYVERPLLVSDGTQANRLRLLKKLLRLGRGVGQGNILLVSCLSLQLLVRIGHLNAVILRARSSHCLLAEFFNSLVCLWAVIRTVPWLRRSLSGTSSPPCRTPACFRSDRVAMSSAFVVEVEDMCVSVAIRTAKRKLARRAQSSVSRP
ncbi:hypothetical protein [Sphingomonas sp. Leaf4]|uniref:hypothetical protein n=1 Tax=Sphingomonas sp. Leaf4 TaxID=2876553 RepID=UPI001E44908A|nr:hypothetical protein [Sphingomonas sp. Leaf4]